MEKDRELRYQTAAELTSDLKRLQRELGSTHAAGIDWSRLPSHCAVECPGCPVAMGVTAIPLPAACRCVICGEASRKAPRRDDNQRA